MIPIEVLKDMSYDNTNWSIICLGRMNKLYVVLDLIILNHVGLLKNMN
jgi:hypothetical protein